LQGGVYEWRFGLGVGLAVVLVLLCQAQFEQGVRLREFWVAPKDVAECEALMP
jgi:hypothetical protein